MHGVLNTEEQEEIKTTSVNHTSVVNITVQLCQCFFSFLQHCCAAVFELKIISRWYEF